MDTRKENMKIEGNNLRYLIIITRLSVILLPMSMINNWHDIVTTIFILGASVWVAMGIEYETD